MEERFDGGFENYGVLGVIDVNFEGSEHVLIIGEEEGRGEVRRRFGSVGGEGEAEKHTKV